MIVFLVVLETGQSQLWCHDKQKLRERRAGWLHFDQIQKKLNF